MDDGRPRLACTKCQGEREDGRKRWEGEREARDAHVRSGGGGGEDAVGTRIANGYEERNDATRQVGRTSVLPRPMHQSREDTPIKT